ncbi:cytochrome P450 [Kitasatospora cinereorecta]|uniref:cytochrome P450 n=1 Tax=unclassified Streptomyces TaxID=2593676 RepID=UPI00338B149D
MSTISDTARPPVDRRTLVSLLRRLNSPDGQADPYPLLGELRSKGDVVPAPWGGAYFVTGFDACNQVLRGREWLAPDFAWQERQAHTERWEAPATQEMTKTLSRLNAPEHTCQRRSLGNLFDRSTIERMTPDVDRDVTRLLDDLAERLRAGPADFAETVSEQLPISTVGSWLSLPPEDYPHLLEITHDQVYAQELLPSRSQLAVSAEATIRLRAYFTELIRQRRATPGDDVLSGWIRTWDELEPDREAADEVLYRLTMFITIASLETTATLLSSVVWHLLEEPSRWTWLRENPEHIDAAIDEALRYDPPIHINTRVAADDTVLAGVPVAKDSMVHVMYGAANHDPRRNPDPYTFDILRAGTHLTFGGGAHYCLGAALARLETRSMLTQLLRRFPTLRAVSPPVFASRMVFRRVTSLSVAI